MSEHITYQEFAPVATAVAAHDVRLDDVERRTGKLESWRDEVNHVVFRAVFRGAAIAVGAVAGLSAVVVALSRVL